MGQGPIFFPTNVFTGPAPNASDSVPPTEPRDVCSIGLGGSIVLGFRSAVVVDGPGADFTIFENAFRYAGRVYAEPARVEVSRDGETWIAFPFDTLTLVGCAGITPTTGYNAFDPTVSGGDAFDLASIGVDTIRWIRITDVTSILLDNVRHPFYDPTLSGFDLDVVVGIHTIPSAFSQALVEIANSLQVRADVVSVSSLSVFNVRGELLHQGQIPAGVVNLDLSTFPRGALIITLVSPLQRHTLKVLR